MAASSALFFSSTSRMDSAFLICSRRVILARLRSIITCSYVPVQSLILAAFGALSVTVGATFLPLERDTLRFKYRIALLAYTRGRLHDIWYLKFCIQLFSASSIIFVALMSIASNFFCIFRDHRPLFCARSTSFLIALNRRSFLNFPMTPSLYS